MDFSDHPLSLTEAKSARSSSGVDWTPRDVLISLLREIDAGRVDLESIFVAGRGKSTKRGDASVIFRASAADPIEAIGVVEMAKGLYIKASHG